MKPLLIGLLVLLAIAVALHGEYVFFTPKGSFTVEVSLENSALPRLPIYRNAITSLEVVGAYAVGGTSSEAWAQPLPVRGLPFNKETRIRAGPRGIDTRPKGNPERFRPRATRRLVRRDDARPGRRLRALAAG